MVARTVVVTGATGFIASWLVKFLLERGYNVRGTVRDPKKAEHLRLLPGAEEHLELLQADLLAPGSFDSVVKGADGVFHTASPFFTNNVTDPQVQLLDPAEKGTLNVLNSCAKAGTKRVVLTSSVAAVRFFRTLIHDNTVLDESAWSEAEYCRENKLWYPLSKTLAEKAAWDFAKEKGLDMVVINPTWVIGPLLQSSLNTSTEVLLGYLSGTAKTYTNNCAGWVGVKDVAMAHILAYENPNATGRYLCSERTLHTSDLVALLAKLYPSYPVPAKCADETSPRATYYILNTQKVQNLGLKYQPLEEVIQETVDCLKDRKLLK